MSINDMSINDMSINDMSINDMSINDMSHNAILDHSSESVKTKNETAYGIVFP